MLRPDRRPELRVLHHMLMLIWSWMGYISLQHKIRPAPAGTYFMHHYVPNMLRPCGMIPLAWHSPDLLATIKHCNHFPPDNLPMPLKHSVSSPRILAPGPGNKLCVFACGSDSCVWQIPTHLVECLWRRLRLVWPSNQEPTRFLQSKPCDRLHISSHPNKTHTFVLQAALLTVTFSFSHLDDQEKPLRLQVTKYR